MIFLRFSLIFTVLLACSPVFAAEWRGVVTRVVDGDTLIVARRGGEFRIRLYGVDCPELRTDAGLRAKALVERLALGKKVRLLLRGQDRYGRTVAEVRLIGGQDLGLTLLAENACWWLEKYAPGGLLDFQFHLQKTAQNRSIFFTWLEMVFPAA